MPNVSILIATHNRACFLDDALASVHSQTLLDWECIVVDDGSSDHTPVVVAEWMARDGRFYYVRQENQGLHHARMTGAALAQGELIAWLDDDDLWLPPYLETLAPLFDADPACVLAAAARLFWDGQHILETQQFTVQQRVRPLSALIRHCFLVPTQCVARRSAFLRTQGFRVDGCCDYDVWLQLAPLGHVAVLDAPLVQYRIHSASFSMADPEGKKRRRLNDRHRVVLRNFLTRRDISLHDRLLAWGNLQRKHEQMLQFDVEEGKVPPSRLARLARLLTIVPSPLLRNPRLARRYLTDRPGAL